MLYSTLQVGKPFGSPFDLTSGTPKQTPPPVKLTPEQLQALEFQKAQGELDTRLNTQAQQAAVNHWTPPPSAPAPVQRPPSVQGLSGNSSPSPMAPPPPPPIPTIGTNVIQPPGASAAERAAEIELAARLEREGASAGLQEKARLNKEAEERLWERVTGLMGGGATSAVAPVSAPGAGGIQANEQAARSAAFGRAKDRAGQNARASMTALREVLASRGGLGGGLEAEGSAEVLGGAGGEVNDYIREELMQDLNRSAAISDREAGADLTRRGQDMASRQSLIGLLASGRGVY